MYSNEKIKLRERCHTYSIRVIKLINALPEKRAYQILSDQLLRSATSIGANVVEAKAASSRKDLINYYSIALKSANETAYWMSLFQEGLDVTDPELDNLRKETEEITRMIAASVLTLKAKQQ